MPLRYTTSVEIDAPRDDVLKAFDDPENLTKWQPELESFEHMDGEPGQVGARSRLVYNMGGRKIEMIETITERNFPTAFSGTYETTTGTSHMANQFQALGDNRTLWVAESEFECRGWMMKIMAFLMPGAFKKQTQQYMNNFKRLVEES